MNKKHGISRAKISEVVAGQVDAPTFGRKKGHGPYANSGDSMKKLSKHLAYRAGRASASYHTPTRLKGKSADRHAEVQKKKGHLRLSLVQASRRAGGSEKDVADAFSKGNKERLRRKNSVRGASTGTTASKKKSSVPTKRTSSRKKTSKKAASKTSQGPMMRGPKGGTYRLVNGRKVYGKPKGRK